jgi:hypothetical protein
MAEQTGCLGRRGSSLTCVTLYRNIFVFNRVLTKCANTYLKAIYIYMYIYIYKFSSSGPQLEGLEFLREY